MEILFEMDNPESREVKNSIEEAVNTAIEYATQAGMRNAKVNVSLEVALVSENQGGRQTVLVSKILYKTGSKIGGNYDGGKGKIRGRLGMWRDQEGYWHTQYADQQLSMVE